MKTTKLKENLKSNEEILSPPTKPCIPDSMLGSLKGKAKPFTRKEREEMWRERI